MLTWEGKGPLTARIGGGGSDSQEGRGPDNQERRSPLGSLKVCSDKEEPPGFLVYSDGSLGTAVAVLSKGLCLVGLLVYHAS